MKNNRRQTVRRTLIVLLVFVLSFCALSMVFSAVFCRFIFPRRDTPPATELRYSDIDAVSYPREEIGLCSGRHRLSAYLYSAEDPKALLIVAGGIGADCDAHLAETMRFVDAGYSVLCYSTTGTGKSEGDWIVGLAQPSLDLDAALDYAVSLPLPVVIYGHSAGAYGAALCADEEKVKCCVCIAGFDSPTELMYQTARGYVGILADIEYPFLCLENFFLFGKRGFESASKSLKESDTPVLLVSGAYDEAIPETLSVSAHKEDINSSFVRYMTVDSPLRGTHTAIWLSEESAAYRKTPIHGDSADRLRANELDEDFMNTVVGFFDRAVLTQ